MVAEVLGRRRVLLPMTRVTHVDGGHVSTTGLRHMRRLARRSTETLVIGLLLERPVRIRNTGITGTVHDVAATPDVLRSEPRALHSDLEDRPHPAGSAEPGADA